MITIEAATLIADAITTAGMYLAVAIVAHAILSPKPVITVTQNLPKKEEI